MTKNNNQTANFQTLTATVIEVAIDDVGNTQDWLRYANAQEQQITLPGQVAIRGSQSVAVLICNDHIAALYNKATRQYTMLMTAANIIGPKVINLWTWLKIAPFILGIAWMMAPTTHAKYIVIGLGVAILVIPAWIQKFIDSSYAKRLTNMDATLKQEVAFLTAE